MIEKVAALEASRLNMKNTKRLGFSFEKTYDNLIVVVIPGDERVAVRACSLSLSLSIIESTSTSKIIRIMSCSCL